jgi:hypothetical protein
VQTAGNVAALARGPHTSGRDDQSREAPAVSTAKTQQKLSEFVHSGRRASQPADAAAVDEDHSHPRAADVDAGRQRTVDLPLFTHGAHYHAPPPRVLGLS